MKNPDEVLKNTSNKLTISTGLFLAMGAAAFIITKNPTMLTVSSVALPFFLNNLYVNYQLHKNKRFALQSSQLTNIYKKNYQKWVNNYIDNSESLTEKKYKILFLSLWIRDKGLTSLDMHDTPINNFLDKLSLELRNEKETQYDIRDLFYSQTDHKLYLFLEEDKDNSKKLAVANKVFKTFEYLGFIGKHLHRLSFSDVKTVFHIQDYKLNNYDIIELKKSMKEFKKRPEIFRQHLFFSEIDKSFFTKLIKENMEHISLIKEYLHTMEHKSDMKQLIELSTDIENSINLSNSLDSSLIIKDKEFRKPIKI